MPHPAVTPAVTPATAPADATASLCPMHGIAEAGLQRHHRLALPMNKRAVVQYADGDGGQRELRLFVADKEISFDDPAMFAFGEALVQQPHFVAEAATQWGPGYRWATVRELLSQLVDEGVLRRVAEGEDLSTPRRTDDGARESLLPPAPAQAACSWHDADTVMHQLTGRALDPAWLELVIPIFRVAHMALDADGRQVGEANVFPPAARLEVPTRWRECIYAGTRHRSERPMNVTALKSMRAHWGTMMALVLHVRQAFLRRYPEAVAGWTVGHLERLSTCVLALPTWMLMRQSGAVPNGQLHPALSSLFRVTDGVRMTMHQMLFVPVGEPALSPDAPMSAAAIHAYAERNYSFHSEHGVCAGPQAMVDEFLAVLVDGHTPRDGLPVTFDAQIVDAMQAVESAIDYGLRGLQAYAVVFSLWPRMARSYEALAGIVEGWAAMGNETAAQLHVRWQAHVDRLRQATYLGTEERRVHRDRVYADMLLQCTRGLGPADAGPSLAERLAPRRQAGDAAAEAALQQALQRHFGHPVDEVARQHLQALHTTVMDDLRHTRAVLREAVAVQQGINVLLGRMAPWRGLEAADLDLHNQLQGAAARHLPFLIDELQAVLGIAISVTSGSIEITTPPTQAPALAGVAPLSAGMGLAEPRA